MPRGKRSEARWQELGPVEQRVLVALYEMHLPYALRSPDGSDDWHCWPVWQISDWLRNKSSEPLPKVGATLANLERKGMVRREKVKVSTYVRGLQHWQITVAGCAALMRLKQEEGR